MLTDATSYFGLHIQNQQSFVDQAAEIVLHMSEYKSPHYWLFQSQGWKDDDLDWVNVLAERATMNSNPPFYGQRRSSSLLFILQLGPIMLGWPRSSLAACSLMQNRRIRTPPHASLRRPKCGESFIAYLVLATL